MQADIETQRPEMHDAMRWMVWFSVEGDLRFLSHRNMMNLCQRAAARAGLPLAFSGGFNPRPKLSLILPRPVGVTSRCEVLTIKFDRVVHDTQWAERFDKQLPAGAKLLRAEPIPSRCHIWVKSVTYQLPLTHQQGQVVLERIARLKIQANLPATTKASEEHEETCNDEVSRDTENLIMDAQVKAGCLTFTLAGNRHAGPAGPGRVLEALGFTDPSMVISRLVRTNIECEIK